MNLKASILIACLIGSVAVFGNVGFSLQGQRAPLEMDCSNSSAIHLAHYFPQSAEMEIEFRSSLDIRYRYENVPLELWQDWEAAESKGGFYQKRIAGKRFGEDTAKSLANAE